MVDMGTPTLPTWQAYVDVYTDLGLTTPTSSFTYDGGGGGTYSSAKSGLALYQTASAWFTNDVIPVFPDANYDNIMVMHGTLTNCWAHNAEYGSMTAFGGPDSRGAAYSFCRDSDITAKQYHIYVCVNP